MNQVAGVAGGLGEEEVRANLLNVSGEVDWAQAYTDLRLEGGRVIRIPTRLLLPQEQLGASDGQVVSRPVQGEVGDKSSSYVIPVVEERLEVSRQTVPTGKVRLHKTVQEYEETLNEPLAVRTFEIERVVLNQPVSSAPAVRYEGDTTVYPVVEEQLVLTKQLILREEVRVTRRDSERRDTRVVHLQREHLTVEREPVARD